MEAGAVLVLGPRINHFSLRIAAVKILQRAVRQGVTIVLQIVRARL